MAPIPQLTSPDAATPAVPEIRLELSRRSLLRAVGLAGGGLLLGVRWPAQAQPTTVSAAAFAPNAFLRIGADDVVTVICKHDEMGQGVFTSIAQVVADELGADFAKVRVLPAPANHAYANPAFKMQGTGGSTSTYTSYQQMRQAGAAAREMLIAAAASRWQVDAAGCTAEEGVIRHAASGQNASFGELALAAAKESVPAEPRLKSKSEHPLIGKPVKRVDSPAKVKGEAIFSIDAQKPGMLIALVARSPHFGGKVQSFDGRRARATAGVKAVVEVPSGVAVVAERFWQARQARAALEIQWDGGDGAKLDTAEMRRQYAELATKKGSVARKDGDPDAELAKNPRRLSTSYDVPFLAHAPMEPLSCMVELRADGGADIVTGSQFLGPDTLAAAWALKVLPDKISIENTFLGGGFGRRATPGADFLVEAIHVAKASGLKAPIKTIWTREDDIRGGYYRPMWHNALAGAVDAKGHIVAWRHRLVGQSIVAGTPFELVMVRDGVDQTAVEGSASLPYDIPNVGVEMHLVKSPITTLWWRSVGHSNNGYATEHFFDELCRLGGVDPFEERRRLLHKHPRHLRVLELAAAKAGWGEALPAGLGRGLTVHESFKSFVAQVADVRLVDGRPRVERVVCAVDCGPVINPDIVRAQIEGGINFALSAVLHGEITLEDGRVQQSNFHDYPLLRIDEAPRIEVHIVDSTDEMGGIGEVAVPPLAAAVANALLALTGKPVRRLPIQEIQ
jgi:isoquinoline 1-oxidoreductase beta subunit